jgi:hypothetical protein
MCQFNDYYGHACSLQKSSLAEEPAIWLGLNEADPKILASEVKPGESGWIKYPIPDSVLLNTRMHLNRD